MIERDYPSHNFKYIRRNPPVPAKEHFQVLSLDFETLFLHKNALHPTADTPSF
jgi:hypothetical protein